MKIRPYTQDDLNQILTLFQNTVWTINSADYTTEQVQVWAPLHLNALAWHNRLESQHTLVVTKDQTIVGFGSIDQLGNLDLLYVHKEYQRKGIAKRLCDALEFYGPWSCILTEASITAKPFFIKRGYTVIGEQYVQRNNIKLKNYKMRLILEVENGN